MPTYEYECKTCKNRFERFQKMTDPAVSECPECGGSVRKLLHPPAIAFKGSGFYVNDYKSGGKPGTAATEKAEAGTGDTNTKPESKPSTESKPSEGGSTPPAA